MPTSIQAYRLGILSVLVGGLASCSILAQSGMGGRVTNIKSIQNSRDANATVYLKGKVSNQAPFLESGAYELEDGTGSIWVITNQTLPKPGDEMLIEGKLQYQSIPIDGKDVGEIYVKEQQQIEKKSAQKR